VHWAKTIAKTCFIHFPSASNYFWSLLQQLSKIISHFTTTFRLPCYSYGDFIIFSQFLLWEWYFLMFCFTFLIIFRFLIDFLRIYPCYSYEPRKLLKNFTFTRQKLFLFHFCCNFLIKIHILLQHKDFHVILMEIFSFFTVFTLRNKYFSCFCLTFLINYHF
jgi:hypothetical protein